MQVDRGPIEPYDAIKAMKAQEEGSDVEIDSMENLKKKMSGTNCEGGSQRKKARRKERVK